VECLRDLHLDDVFEAVTKEWKDYELTPLDRSYLADIERGHRNVSLVNLDLIAAGFDVSLSQLFSRL
jgi:transcriptional regulator with XRE-family HTH domain